MFFVAVLKAVWSSMSIKIKKNIEYLNKTVFELFSLEKCYMLGTVWMPETEREQLKRCLM